MVKIEQVYLGRTDMYDFCKKDKGDVENHLFSLLADKVNELPFSDCIINVFPSLNQSVDNGYEYFPSAVVVINTELRYVVSSSRQSLEVISKDEKK